MDVRFEWDPHKAASNLSKHGVSFELAALAFLDRYALSEQDRIVDGEERWQLIGSVHGQVLLLVAHTVCGELVEGSIVETFRIISARRADSKERRRYEQQTGSVHD